MISKQEFQNKILSGEWVFKRTDVMNRWVLDKLTSNDIDYIRQLTDDEYAQFSIANSKSTISGIFPAGSRPQDAIKRIYLI